MRIDVLDGGYVQLIEAYGVGKEGRLEYEDGVVKSTDFEVGIIEAARMSTGRGFNGWEQDEKLLKFLYANRHMSPFEMAGMIVEVKAPIFVFREWHRHRTQSYNEMSGRYIPLPDENYRPSSERLIASQAATSNKQAQGTSGFEMTPDSVRQDLEVLDAVYNHAQESYQYLLKRGWPKELARLVVPVSRYSRMRAHANLRNWLQFLTLRMDPAAQWEIRRYANAVGALIENFFPKTWNAYILAR